MSSNKTPIRVRGKRSGTKPEKWNAGKARRRVHKTLSSPELPTTSSPGRNEAPRPSKRRKVDLSNLEALPNEMVQAIFVHSGNLDLPSTSSNLNDRLSGKQLQWELTCKCLPFVIMCDEGNEVTAVQLASATRLLNSRFMTWELFRNWLDHESDVRALVIDTDVSNEEAPRSHYADVWRALRPSPQLLTPSKVLHGPWTPDRVAFLEVFSFHANDTAPPLDGIRAEIAYEGLAQAVEERCLQVIKLLRNLQVQPDQDILRKAVIDFDCDKAVVLYLLQWFVLDLIRWNTSSAGRSDPRPRPEFDLLDPPLWNWAEKAKLIGEPKGQWLTDLLKDLSITAASEDTRELRRLERDDSLYITQWQ